MILLVYKEAYFNTNDLDNIVPSVLVSLLQDFDDVYLDATPSRLPPLRGIEHNINLVHKASIINRPSYIRNLEEIKEFQRLVNELQRQGLSAGWKAINKTHGLYFILLAIAQGLFGLKLRLCF